MTREEADFIGAMNMCDEISNEAYKKIMCHCEEQEPCEDAISRKAMLEYQQYLHGKMPNEENHKLWEFIKELPSVTPKQKTGKWIKLKDQSPETYQNVLVKDIDGDVTCAYIVDEVDACTSFYESFSGEYIEDVVEWREIQE
jgi:hypothetical protein